MGAVTPVRKRRQRRALVILGAVVLLAAVGVAAAFAWQSREPASSDEAVATPSASPTPTAKPLTPAEQLIADAANPSACAASFAGEHITAGPSLQMQGQLFAALPIPDAAGLVFAGWFATPEDAAAQNTAARINGSEVVTCVDQHITLHGAWTTPEQNAAADTEVPILMYHQFTTRPEGEDGWLRGNYAYIADFDAHMQHIADTDFYLPTWDELSAFIDGRLALPARSVIVTDDDADQSWFDLAVPIIERTQVMATSFMVTIDRQDQVATPYVIRRSHTHDMHRAGASGEGLMVNLSAEEIAADLRQSADILGVGEVVAYPFGHHNDTTKQGVADAGYAMGRTIEPGTVSIGTDRYALPVVRIDYGMDLDDLIRRIG